MFRRGQCFGGVIVLKGSVFWRGQCFGGVSVLEGSVLWRGQCFGVISVSYLFSFLCVVIVLFFSVLCLGPNVPCVSSFFLCVSSVFSNV